MAAAIRGQSAPCRIKMLKLHFQYHIYFIFFFICIKNKLFCKSWWVHLQPHKYCVFVSQMFILTQDLQEPPKCAAYADQTRSGGALQIILTEKPTAHMPSRAPRHLWELAITTRHPWTLHHSWLSWVKFSLPFAPHALRQGRTADTRLNVSQQNHWQEAADHPQPQLENSCD